MDVNAPISELVLDEAGWIIVGHYLPPWDVIVVGVGWEPSLHTQRWGDNGMKLENWNWDFWRGVHGELLFTEKYFSVVRKTESLKNDILKGA